VSKEAANKGGVGKKHQRGKLEREGKGHRRKPRVKERASEKNGKRLFRRRKEGEKDGRDQRPIPRGGTGGVKRGSAS